MLRDMPASSSNNKIVTIVIEKNDAGRLAGIDACSRTEAPPKELQPCMDNTAWHAFVAAFNEELAVQENAHDCVYKLYMVLLLFGGALTGILIAIGLLSWSDNWDFPGAGLFLIVCWFAFPFLGVSVGILIRSRLRTMLLEKANLELTRVCDEHSSERVRFSFSNNCSLYRETVRHDFGGINGPVTVEYLRCHDIQAHILRNADDPAMKHSKYDSLAEDARSVSTSETGTDGELYSMDDGTNVIGAPFEIV